MNTLFILLRIITGITSLIALGILGLVIFIRDTGSLVKDGIGVLGYVTKLFASGFTEGTAPTTQSWQIGPWQIVIALLTFLMLASVFTPSTRWLLHGTAILGAIVAVGYARLLSNGTTLEMACIPFLAFWCIYYAVSLLYKPSAVSP